MPAARPRVVGFVGVRQHAVRQRRLHRSAQDRVANDRRHFFPAVGSRERGRGAARSQLGSRDHRGERVEHVPLRLFEHAFGQRTIARLTHVGAEPRHDVADRVLDGCGPCWWCNRFTLRNGPLHNRLGYARTDSRGDGQAGSLQNLAARQREIMCHVGHSSIN